MSCHCSLGLSARSIAYAGHRHLRTHEGTSREGRMTGVEARFWAKVSGGDVDTCWEWTAALNASGYGAFGLTPQNTVRAHRWAYEALRAEIPDGLHLDHLCRNRACVNPWHLEPVTNKVNSERGLLAMRTHCSAGHAYDEANTRRIEGRGRDCRTCARAAQDERRRLRVELLAADPTVVEHGRLSTYTNWMCRCQECRDVRAEYRLEWLSRRTGSAA